MEILCTIQMKMTKEIKKISWPWGDLNPKASDYKSNTITTVPLKLDGGCKFKKHITCLPYILTHNQ